MTSLLLHNIKRKSIINILILLVWIKITTSEWTAFKTRSTYFPAHTYQINCRRLSSIAGNITWQGSADVDAKLYQSGSNFLSSSSIANFTSSAQIRQSFSYNCSSTANYYLRVYPYNLNQHFLPYSVHLQTSTETIFGSSTFYNSSSIKTKQAIVANVPQTKSIALKYTYSSSSKAEIQVYGTSFDKIIIPENSSVCVPAQSTSSNLIFVINDNITSATTLSQYNITFYYDPSPCENTTTNETSAAATSSSSSIGIAIGCTVAGLIVVGVIVFFCVRRYKKMKEQAYIKRNERPNQMEQQQQNSSVLNMNVDPQVSCSICLDQQCNAKLMCGHFYHKKCIQQWMKRNNQCPLCRGMFTKSKMQCKKSAL